MRWYTAVVVAENQRGGDNLWVESPAVPERPRFVSILRIKRVPGMICTTICLPNGDYIAGQSCRYELRIQLADVCFFYSIPFIIFALLFLSPSY